MKDQYLITMKFAEELLQFLHKECPLLYEIAPIWAPKLTILEFDKLDDSFFHDEIGWSVFHIINEYLDIIEKCYEDFLDEMDSDDIDDSLFTRCALKIAPLFFCEGYTHSAFLGYCALVLGVAYNFLYSKPNGIPQSACQVVGLVFFTHQMSGEFYSQGGWNSFLDVSRSFNKCVEDSPTKPKRKD